MKKIDKRIIIGITFIFFVGAFVLADFQTTYSAPPAGFSKTAEPAPVTRLDTTSVFVENTEDKPALVRDVDNPARHAFQKEIKVKIKDGGGGENGWVDVPEGQRVVIEQVSASCFPPTGQKVLFSVLTRIVPDLTERKHLLQTGQSTFGAQAMFMASQSVRLYSDPVWGVRVDRDSTSGELEATFVVSGYTVDMK